MSVEPGRLNLRLISGDDYELTLTFVDDAVPPVAQDYSGQTFEAKVSIGATTVDFTQVTTDIDTGVLVLSLTDTQTAALPLTSAWYLRKIDAGGLKSLLLRGTVTVSPETE